MMNGGGKKFQLPGDDDDRGNFAVISSSFFFFLALHTSSRKYRRDIAFVHECARTRVVVRAARINEKCKVRREYVYARTFVCNTDSDASFRGWLYVSPCSMRELKYVSSFIDVSRCPTSFDLFFSLHHRE